MAQISVDLTQYEAQDSFDLLPPGWYSAEIINSEIKEGKKGPYINWTFQIIGKPNHIWTVTSLGNEVSMKILKTMATCCGHRNPNYIADTEELHGKKCMIKVKIKTDENGDYEPKNEISGYKPMDGAKVATAVNNIPPAHIAAAAMTAIPADTKMPWQV
jgi:hypothetical protein